MSAIVAIPTIRQRQLAGLGQGTPVDLKLLFWGVSFVALAAYLFGSKEPPPRTRKRSTGQHSDGVAADAVSALVNQGFSRRDAAQAVAAARRSGTKGFDATMRKAFSLLQRAA